MKNIKDILNEFIGKFAEENEFYSTRAKVLTVDTEKNMCTVETLDNESEIVKVQISAFIGSTLGFFLIPAIDSVVTVGFYSPDEAYITKTSIIDAFKILLVNQGEKDINLIIDNNEISIGFDNSVVKFTTDLIQFNTGALGGLVKVAELTARFNDLESLHNTLKSNFSSWTPVPNDGGAALKTIIAAGYGAANVPDSQETDFENENITQ